VAAAGWLGLGPLRIKWVLPEHLASPDWPVAKRGATAGALNGWVHGDEPGIVYLNVVGQNVVKTALHEARHLWQHANDCLADHDARERDARGGAAEALGYQLPAVEDLKCRATTCRRPTRPCRRAGRACIRRSSCRTPCSCCDPDEY
jgi:hypothetical protein